MTQTLHQYYFSGTGNAKNVAHRIVKKAEELGISAQISDLSQINRKNIPAPAQNEIVGFVSPTHGFNLPPVSMYFIFRFPRAKFKNKVFIVNTRAGMKLGKLFIPGLSGIALWLAAIVMWLKGYKIIGLRSIDLPSNWISLHPGLREKVAQSIQEHCAIITDKFAQKIFTGTKVYRAFYGILPDLLISPIAVLYFLIGRFILAKTFYANSKCNNCNACIDGCPVHAIKNVGNQPYWTFKCESCMKCMNTCPQRAIETGHGYVFGLIVLIKVFIVVSVWKYIAQFSFLPETVWALKIINFIIEAGLTLFFFMIGYWLIHYLKRLVIFKQIIEYSSLTRFRFWRRYRNRSKV